MTINDRDLEIANEEAFSPYETVPDLKRGRVVAVEGEVSGAEGHVWVQPTEVNSPPIQVFNPGVVTNVESGMLVYYRKHPRHPARWSLAQFDSSVWADQPGVLSTLITNGTGPHAETHEWYPGYQGFDAINVNPRQITDFAVRANNPADMKASVYSGWYMGQAGNWERFVGPKNTKDFTSNIPSSAGMAVIEAITLQSDGTLAYVLGTEYVDGNPIPSSAWPCGTAGPDATIRSQASQRHD